MKGFLYKVTKFFAILLLLAGGSLTVTYLLSMNAVKKLTLDADIHILIGGDSHTKTAINDSVLPNSINIAHSSEHYFYTYYVLRVMIGNNPHVNTVILGLAYHNLSSFYDDYIYDLDKTQYMYPRYFAVLNAEGISKIIMNNPMGLLRDFKDIYHGVYRHIGAQNTDDFSFMGWFYNSKRNNLNEKTVSKALESHYYPGGNTIYGISLTQVEYLHRIIELCEEKDVRLILINCPVSDKYMAGVPDQYLDYYREFSSENEGIVWDYHSFKVAKECWGDGDHLNLCGSIMFTESIKEEVIHGLK